jgi:hypothetical protein
MAESTYHLAGRQHLARHQQEASAHPVVLVHQHQQALVAVQDLERQRLDRLIPDQDGELPQSQPAQQL